MAYSVRKRGVKSKGFGYPRRLVANELPTVHHVIGHVNHLKQSYGVPVSLVDLSKRAAIDVVDV